MKESFPAQKNIENLEASRTTSDEKLKEGDRAYMVELPNGRRQLELEESLIEELRRAMEQDLTEREIVRLAEESGRKSVDEFVQKQLKNLNNSLLNSAGPKSDFASAAPCWNARRNRWVNSLQNTA